LQKRSTEVVKYIYEKTKGEIPIIASGGIFTGADAKEKFDAGHHWYRFGQVLFMKDRDRKKYLQASHKN
jgi:dihydroorotate dehydrogenase